MQTSAREEGVSHIWTKADTGRSRKAGFFADILNG